MVEFAVIVGAVPPGALNFDKAAGSPGSIAVGVTTVGVPKSAVVRCQAYLHAASAGVESEPSTNSKMRSRRNVDPCVTLHSGAVEDAVLVWLVTPVYLPYAMFLVSF